MLPPGGGTNNVDPRYISLFSSFVLNFPTQDNLERIYNNILRAHLSIFPAEVSELVVKIG